MFKRLTTYKVKYPPKPRRINVAVQEYVYIAPSNVLVSQMRQKFQGVSMRVFGRVN